MDRRIVIVLAGITLLSGIIAPHVLSAAATPSLSGRVVHDSYSLALTATGGSTLGLVDSPDDDILLVSSTDAHLSLLLPSGLIVRGGSTWDGTVHAPRVETHTTGTGLLVSVGNRTSPLTFDHKGVLSVPVTWTENSPVTVRYSTDGVHFEPQGVFEVDSGRVSIPVSHVAYFALTASGTDRLIATTTGATASGVADFSDIGGSFSRDQIRMLHARGIIGGFGDGTFRPTLSTTRAEFLRMAMRALSIGYDANDTKNPPFVDTSRVGWHVQVSKKAKELGIVSGQKSGDRWYFRPNDPITRAEAVKILLRLRGITVSTTPMTSEFADVSEGWMIPYVARAKELGIVSGQRMGTKSYFRPRDPMTRQEVAKVLARMLQSPAPTTTEQTTPTKHGVDT